MNLPINNNTLRCQKIAKKPPRFPCVPRRAGGGPPTRGLHSSRGALLSLARIGPEKKPHDGAGCVAAEVVQPKEPLQVVLGVILWFLFIPTWYKCFFNAVLSILREGL